MATYTDSPENLNWVPVEDDGCRWALPPDIEGGPFAALPCDVDGSPVEIGEDEVRCPKCGKHTAAPLRQTAGHPRKMERNGGSQASGSCLIGNTLADSFLHIPHDHSGECCGCIRPVEANGCTIELRCNECGAIVGVLDRSILEDLVWLVNERVKHA